jgi:hypothetical protein
MKNLKSSRKMLIKYQTINTKWKSCAYFATPNSNINIMWKQSNLLYPIFCVCMGFFSLMANAQTPAFPGAEGGGRLTTGGRGGKVLFVNSLDDAVTGDIAKREGTLRWCLGQDGSRTILFKVSGIIDLKSPLIITKGDVTIAGQSAPGDGICLRNFPTQIDANNVIIRFIRFRLGDLSKQESSAIWGRNRNNIILDHCSMSWTMDECASFYSNKNFTLQWSIISESFRNSVYGKGPHGYGGIWGGENASFHHNLMAHHDSRNPRFNGWKRAGLKYASTISEERVDFRNNVIYNWGSNGAYGGEAAGKYNMVNNVFRFGPATRFKYRIVQCYSDPESTYGVPHGRFFLSGNHVFGNPVVSDGNEKGVDNQTRKPIEEVVVKEPFAFSTVTTHPAEKAFEKVLSFAGCSLKRDSVDIRVASEAKTGKFTYTGSNGGANGLIDSQQDVGGWPQYVSVSAPLDTDADGIPDEWETAHGLDPSVASDAVAKTLSQEGYTNLEVYLNSLVESITTHEIADGAIASK